MTTDTALYIFGLVALAAIIAASVSFKQVGLLMRERSERDGKLIDRLADKVSAQSDLQLKRIEFDMRASEATAEAAREYARALTQRNGQAPSEEDIENEIASRG